LFWILINNEKEINMNQYTTEQIDELEYQLFLDNLKMEEFYA